MNQVSYDQPDPGAGTAQPQGPAWAAQQSQAWAGQQAQGEALAQGFLARVQRDIDEQVDLRVQQQLASRSAGPSSPPALPVAQQSRSMGHKGHGEDVGIALGSLVFGIPLSAIAGSAAQLTGIIVVWVGLVIINLAWSQRQ